MAIVMKYTTVVTMVYKPTNRTGRAPHCYTGKMSSTTGPLLVDKVFGDSMRGQPIMKNMRMFDISDKSWLVGDPTI